MTITQSLHDRCGEVFQSSLDNTGKKECDTLTKVDAVSESYVVPANSSNGLIGTVLMAYNEHHHLVLRPDDIWTAILTQFSRFMNAGAEELRHRFVVHKSKEDATVVALENRYSANFGRMAQSLTHVLHEKLVDPQMRDWIMPNFTTTTDNDRVVSAILMMDTLKKYFNYGIMLLCGLPAVTLLGERLDWEKIASKIDKLRAFGPVATDC